MAEEKMLTPMKAIRAKCLDCCCWQQQEVRLCPATGCPLHPYRMGKNPNRKVSEERREALAKHLEKARAQLRENSNEAKG